MKPLLIALVLLAGCSGSYEKDGTTAVSYCLLGGVYVDQSNVKLEEYKPAQRPLCAMKE